MGSSAKAALSLVLVAAGAVYVSGCDRGRSEGSSEPAVLVIEDPQPLVVSGTDTTRVFAPTIFAYMGLDPDQPPTSAVEAQKMVSFQRDLQAAHDRLREEGVDVKVVSQPPRVTRRPPDAPGPGVTDGFTGTYGYLLVDAPGHERKIEGALDSGSLVCAAVTTFALNVPGC